MVKKPAMDYNFPGSELLHAARFGVVLFFLPRPLKRSLNA